jgi:hypothetical protein
MQLEWNEIPGGGQVSLNYFERLIDSYIIRISNQEGKLISSISTSDQENAYMIYNRELNLAGMPR